MECPNCGAQVWSSAEHCNDCGHTLDEAGSNEGGHPDGTTQSDIKESSSTDEPDRPDTEAQGESDEFVDAGEAATETGRSSRESDTGSSGSAESGLTRVVVGLVVVTVLGVIVAAAVVPSLIESQSNGASDSIDPAGADESTPDPTPESDAASTDPPATSTPAQVNSPTATATPVSVGTATPTETSSPEPADSELTINRTRLESEIAAEINAYRQRNGLKTLQTSGVTSDKITEMSRNHTRQLREDGQA